MPTYLCVLLELVCHQERQSVLGHMLVRSLEGSGEVSKTLHNTILVHITESPGEA